MIVSYKIDLEDRLVWVNDEWTAFAQRNDGKGLLPEQVAGKVLWDYIDDSVTVYLYRLMIKKVRATGGTVAFRLRCDSPNTQRIIDLSAQPDGDYVRFDCNVISETHRDPVALLDASAQRSEEWIQMCAWCKRIPLPDGWTETEKAIQQLGLFQLSRLPKITHSICPDCYAAAIERLKSAE